VHLDATSAAFLAVLVCRSCELHKCFGGLSRWSLQSLGASRRINSVSAAHIGSLGPTTAPLVVRRDEASATTLSAECQ